MDILELLNSLSKDKSGGSTIEYIVAGLGNPGKKYEGTRHNAGFVAIDMLCQKYGGKFSLKSAHRSEEAEITVDGKRILLIKPQTFMNNSGEGISLAARFYKIPAEKIIVMYDDIALEPGILRFREKGIPRTRHRTGVGGSAWRRFPCLREDGLCLQRQQSHQSGLAHSRLFLPPDVQKERRRSAPADL